MAQYVIGIDVGTQGTKTALLREDGVVVAEAFVASRLIRPGPGMVEEDPEDMLAAAIKTIREVMDEARVISSEVVSMALDGQMAGVVGVGEDGQAVTPYDSWLDQRCGAYWEPLRQLGETEIIGLTGCPITYAHGPKILWWKGERPDVWRRIAKFVQPAAYVAMRLCGLQGKDAFIDHTYLHFSGYADTARREWSESLLNAARVDRDKMPKIVKPHDIVGYVTEEMARVTGLCAGMPVAAGCGDTAASILGAGVVRPGMLIDVAGTASVFACAVDRFSADTKNKTLLFAPSVIDGLYTPMAYINGGGLCLKWFRDEVAGGGLEATAPSYQQLESEAEAVNPGSDKLVFLPHFGGRVCPNDGAVRGSWMGLQLSHGRGHLFRSIMEGIGYEYAMYLDIIRELVPELKPECVLAVGGGAKSPIMRQIKADILGLPIATISRSDTGVLGTGVIAGHAVGLFPSMEETVSKWVKPIARTQPTTSAHHAYEPYTRIYRESFAALAPVFGSLAGL